MEDVALWEKLFMALKDNSDYQEAAKAVAQLEGDYLAVTEALSEEQRERIESYICACDVQSDSMIVQAYQLGYQLGRLDPFVVGSS